MSWSNGVGWTTGQGWYGFPAPVTGGGGGGDTTPILIASGWVDPAVSNPSLTSTAAVPAGSVIIAFLAVQSGVPTGFSDGANTYTSPAGSLSPTAAKVSAWRTGIISTQLDAGAALTPTLTGTNKLFMDVVAFPGAVAADPETPQTATGSNTDISVSVPAIASGDAPQYVAFMGYVTSHGADGTTGNTLSAAAGGWTSTGTDGGTEGGFGVRFWTQKFTSAQPSGVTCTAEFTGGAGSVAWAAITHTVKVSS